MRVIDADLITTLEQAEQGSLVALIQIGPKDGTFIRRVLWNQNVVFEGNIYYADNGEFSEIKFESRMSSIGFELMLQNMTDPVTEADLPWSETLSVKGKRYLEGASVVIKLVDITKLDKGGLSLSGWNVGNVVLGGDGYLSVKAGMPFDMLQLQVLMPTLGSVICIWKYKGPECGSQSNLPFCNKTVSECAARFPGQPLRFSSWPFLDTMVRRVLR